jgi:outer membrane receptor protein involved in Fe transport
VGDAGTTTAGRPSGRTGFEVSAYAALGSRGHVDADLAVSRARFPDDAVDDVVPGAARMVASAGLSVDAWGGFDAGLRWRYLGSRALTETDDQRSHPTSTLNARVSYAVARRLQFEIEIFNLLGDRVSDIDYFYVSRLPGEPLEGSPIGTHTRCPHARSE